MYPIYLGILTLVHLFYYRELKVVAEETKQLPQVLSGKDAETQISEGDVSTHVYVGVWVCLWGCVGVFVGVYDIHCTCVWVYVHTCVCLWVYVCVWVCVRVCVCILYIHIKCTYKLYTRDSSITIVYNKLMRLLHNSYTTILWTEWSFC